MKPPIDCYLFILGVCPENAVSFGATNGNFSMGFVENIRSGFPQCWVMHRELEWRVMSPPTHL